MSNQLNLNVGKLPKPILSSYTDYRVYLRDVFEFKKKTESIGYRIYSYSDFSAAADIKSPNYLKMIIEGKRNLSAKSILKFSKALHLDKEQSLEFKALVEYNQAVEPLERNRFLKKLSEIRVKKRLEENPGNKEQLKEMPNWVSWVLYALADQKNIDFGRDDLETLFCPEVSPSKMKASLKKMIDSEHLYKEGKTGAWIKKRELLSKVDSIPVEVVRKLQSELIYLGMESLFRDAPQEREFGAFTLALTEKEFEKVRFELRKVRKKIQKDIMMERERSKGDRVYQLNIQLFPLTKKSHKK